MAGVMTKCPFYGIPDFRMPPETFSGWHCRLGQVTENFFGWRCRFGQVPGNFCGGVTCFHPKIRSSNEDFHRKGAEVAEETLKRVCISGYCRAFFTAISFHPLGEPSSSIGFPTFLSSHMQSSAFLCDLCAFAVKN
jgi:hypothetical protein